MWARLFTLVALSWLLAPNTAGADPCKAAGGQWLPACQPPVRRNADRAEGSFWRNRGREGRPAQPPINGLGPSLYLPSPVPPTANGPMSIDDLNLRPRPEGGFVGTRPGYRLTIDRDGTVHFVDPPPVEVTTFFLIPLGFAGVFDATDVIMRMYGVDPYAFDKRRVLEITADMRGEMEKAERKQRIDSTLAELPWRLQAIWRDSRLTERERRTLIFRLWDETLEADDKTDDPQTLGAAAKGRRLIVDFVRRRLPVTDPAGFSSPELEKLNAARNSTEKFEPYGRGTTRRDPPVERLR